jgi:hypothetical protein
VSLRVSIDDMGLELSITVSVSGGYNPDVLHDLAARAGEAYRVALVDKMAVMASVDTTDSTDESDAS